MAHRVPQVETDPNHIELTPEMKAALKNAVAELQKQGGIHAITQERQQAGTVVTVQQPGTVVTVQQPDGEHVTGDNNQEGLSPDERQDFLQGRKTQKHEQVMEALKTLCGNDKQYVLAMVALSQSGPSGVWKSFGDIVDGGKSESEHSALEYLFTKRKDVNVSWTSSHPTLTAGRSFSAR